MIDWDEAWVVVEIFGGLPEGLWVCRTKEKAERVAQEVADEAGFTWDEDEEKWLRGDSELFILTGELQPEGEE